MDDWRTYDSVAEPRPRAAPRFAEAAQDLVQLSRSSKATGCWTWARGPASASRPQRTSRPPPSASTDRSRCSPWGTARPSLPLLAPQVVDLLPRPNVRRRDGQLRPGALRQGGDGVVRRPPRTATGWERWASPRGPTLGDAPSRTRVRARGERGTAGHAGPRLRGGRPGHEQLKHPETVVETLRRAGSAASEPRRQAVPVDLRAGRARGGLGTWTVGRFVREMLGESGWALAHGAHPCGIRGSVRDALNDFRDVIVAVGALPARLS